MEECHLGIDEVLNDNLKPAIAAFISGGITPTVPVPAGCPNFFT